LKSSDHTQLLLLKRFIKTTADTSTSTASNSLDKAFLSTIVSLVSLNVLARNSCLKNLERGFNELKDLSAEQLLELSNALYKRAKSLAPASLESLPPPRALTPSGLKAFQKFLSASESLPLFAGETAIGHAYQLCAQSRRKSALKQVQSSNKDLDAETLISFTQLYTPGWIVDLLIDETIPLVCQNTFNVIDPACGGGNFLLPSFEKLLQMFQRNGLTESAAVELMADGALCGVDLDPHAIWITSLSLTVRCLRLEKPLVIRFKGIQLLKSENESEALLGTLDRNYNSVKDHPLAQTYDAVLTNPPYIGRKLLSRELKQLLKVHYKEDSHDISVAFTRRCLELLKTNGRLGLITQSSILFLPSSRPFREMLTKSYNPLIVIEAGPGVFPLQTGEKIDSVLMVIEKGTDSRVSDNDRQCTFINSRNAKDKQQSVIAALKSQQSDAHVYVRSTSGFSRFPNCQFNYACPQAALTLFEKLPKLENFADVRQGLATTDNDRFVRYRWEVPEEELNKVWFPYVKGTNSKRWYSPVLNVVNWSNDGAEIKEAVQKAYPYLNGKVHWVVKNEQHYFKEGLTFSFVNNGSFAARLMPSGCIFDVAASALFPISVNRFTLLAFLNSSYATKIAHLINPTINFQVGDVKRLPFIPFTEKESEEIALLASDCVELTEKLLRERDFHIFELLDKTASTDRKPFERFKTYEEHCAAVKHEAIQLRETEAKIDRLVMAALKAKKILSEKEYEEIETWIDQSPPRSELEPLSQNDFEERSRNSRELSRSRS